MKFIYILLLLCCFGCSENTRGETYDDDTVMGTETSTEDMEVDAGTDRDSVFEDMDMDADTGDDTDEDADTGMGTETETVIDDTGTETVIQDTSEGCREVESNKSVTILSTECVYIPVESDYNQKDLDIVFSGLESQGLTVEWVTCGPGGTMIDNLYTNISQGRKSVMTFDEYSSDCDIVLYLMGDGSYIDFGYIIGDS